MKKIVVVFLHLSYWFLYSFIILLVWSSSQDHSGPPPHLEGWEALRSMLRVILFSNYALLCFWPGFIAFYISYFVLFDKFLGRKKTGAMVLSILAICLVLPALSDLIMFTKDSRF